MARKNVMCFSVEGCMDKQSILLGFLKKYRAVIEDSKAKNSTEFANYSSFNDIAGLKKLIQGVNNEVAEAMKSAEGSKQLQKIIQKIGEEMKDIFFIENNIVRVENNMNIERRPSFISKMLNCKPFAGLNEILSSIPLFSYKARLEKEAEKGYDKLSDYALKSYDLTDKFRRLMHKLVEKESARA